MKWNKFWLKLIIIVGLAFVLGALLAPYFLLKENIFPEVNFESGNKLGAAFGGLIGPFVAIGAALLTFAAFMVQYEANKKIQGQFKKQQFESHFFKMLDLHVRNVEALQIDRFEYNPKTGINGKSKINGRRVFLSMVEEFHKILDIVYKIHKIDICKKKEDLNTLAYQIFFFGSNSEHVKPIKSKEKILIKLVERLKGLKGRFRNSESEKRTMTIYSELFEIRTRHVPFSGHESRLAHYYRHLYEIVKYTVESQNNEVIEYKDARQYLKILRAQLSNQEQLLLYYNYQCGFGKNWDKKGKKHRFFTYYRMLHNIPLDDNRIHNAFEHPRDHFCEFIYGPDRSDKDELFEWGDNFSEENRIKCFEKSN
ncbi:putative phage abortive infection protein [Lutibacter citreus]|uniref:putative phage abortive infection protein n=1 Tax=Lutibacter citreus TaxID=2138210 RepID=UPI000DBE1451|nr:putative phage abortive infection protein [Lutibacter citreus]